MSNSGEEIAYIFSHKDIIDVCTNILSHHGLPKKDARIVADSLVSANLRGVDSHGVSRMGIYVTRIKHGLVGLSGEIEILTDKGATLLIDGKDGMGAPVTVKALEYGIERAKKFGSCTIGIKNSSHYGAGGYYIQKAVSNNVTAHMYSNAPPTMAPWGGVSPYLGTNPYSFGAPSRKYQPIILDMASSVVARGKIIAAAREGKTIPDGWAIDAIGKPTNNAQEALDGTVLPFAGPKGYGIALMIDLMAGVLTGANFGGRIPDLYRDLTRVQNVGVCIHLVDIAAFQSSDEFLDRIDTLIEEVKNNDKAPNVDEIYLPGEIEANTEKERLQKGIPLEEKTFQMLLDLCNECGIDLKKFVLAEEEIK